MAEGLAILPMAAQTLLLRNKPNRPDANVKRMPM
jgi:hypothetical protein